MIRVMSTDGNQMKRDGTATNGRGQRTPDVTYLIIRR